MTTKEIDKNNLPVDDTDDNDDADNTENNNNVSDKAPELNSVDTPNPTASIIVFLVFTFIYFIAEYVLPDEQKNLVFYMYIIVLIITQFFINLQLTASICGTNQWYTTILVTAIPWIVIFGTLNIMLSMFPGWLQPFSNTIGYGVVKLAGLNSILKKILKPYNKSNSTNELTKALANVNDDYSLLINKIPPDNEGYNTFMNKANSLFVNKTQGNKEEFDKLRKLVSLKATISKLIWFLLTGMLTVSAAFNYLSNTGCVRSLDDMERLHNEYQNYVDHNNNVAKASPPPRVYTSYE